jgi:predicted ATPase
LGEEEAQEFLTALLGEEVSAERTALERLILEKTEGNPFFTEELVQTLAEERVLAGERGGYRLERSPSELHIPATVQGILAARMDRLPPHEKDLLQTLAVIGKEFPFGLLRGVAEQREEDLYRGLSHLQAAEFVYEQPAFPDLEYTFKHALTQEVAYESLLVERRAVLHERTAQAIEEMYRDTLDAHYGELAHHYGRTENIPKAVRYLHLAGEQAVQRSAYTEAIGQLRRGVELVGALSDTRERAKAELPLQLTLGEALTTTQGFAAPEVERAYLRARDLCEEVGEAPQLLRALQGLFASHLIRGELERIPELAEQLLRLARGTRDPAHLLIAPLAMGITSFFRGEFRQAQEQLEEVIQLYDPHEHQTHEYLYASMDPGVSALAYSSWTLSLLGYPDRAVMRGQEALTLARELSHPFSEAFALSTFGVFHWYHTESQAALEAAEALIDLSSEHGFPFWAAVGNSNRASALIAQGQAQEAIAGMRAAVEAMRRTGTVLTLPMMLAVLAEAHGKVGQAEEGLALVAEASDLMRKTGARAFVQDMALVEGELLLAQSPSNREGAEASFRKALDIGQRQNAKSWELRAATSLARLWQQQGRTDEARELLAPVYDWFTEGFDTRDLKEAKALLQELESVGQTP